MSILLISFIFEYTDYSLLLDKVLDHDIQVMRTNKNKIK